MQSARKWLEIEPIHNNLFAGSGCKVVDVGDAKLELEYNDLNPQHPVMMVKLLDILFQSSKQLPSGEIELICWIAIGQA